MARRLVDFWFRNRKTGRITIGQWPNVWVYGYIVSRVLGVGLLATAFLLVWAALEITRGVNPFRRALGAFVLAGLCVQLIR